MRPAYTWHPRLAQIDDTANGVLPIQIAPASADLSRSHGCPQAPAMLERSYIRPQRLSRLSAVQRRY